jgi:uncharacterized membrane protein
MRSIYRFLLSTLFGGLVVLLPLIALGAIVVWGGQIALQIISPLISLLPDQSVGGVSLTALWAVLALVASCFLAGLVAETAIIRGLGQYTERLALSVPGYALMKSVGASLIGVESKRLAKTVMVRFEASCQLGFLMETLADGRLVIFIPGVPRALVGTLHIVTEDRVQVLDMSVAATLDALGRLGVGLGELRPRASISA